MAAVSDAKFRFTLFIAGDSVRSVRAEENLRALGRDRLKGDFELDVIDAIERPEEAEAQHIMATPTLIKHAPDPVRRVTGDLSDRDAVALALGLPR